MTHEDGTIEYVTIERADEPVEAGTPINKALFDSISNDILYSNKYGIPSIEKTVGNANSFTSDPTPVFTTSDTSGTTRDGYTITCSSENGAVGGAFDHDGSNSWQLKSVTTGWCQITFPSNTRIKLTQLQISVNYLSTTSNAQNVQGLLENGTWETIATFTGNKGKQTFTLDINTNNYYKAIRVNIEGYSKLSSSCAMVYLINMVSGSIGTLCNKLNMEHAINEYVNNLIFKVKVNEVLENVNSYLCVNDLESKQINGTLTSNKYYELVYNETTDMFDIALCSVA